MKYKFLCSLILLSFTLLIGCKKDEQKILRIYTWTDYIDPKFVEQFEKENNCKVVIDTFDSNETMFSKLMIDNCNYDICCPTEYYIPILKNAELIEKLDTTKLINVINNFDPRFLNKLERLEYHIPYAVSCTGIIYRKDIYPNITIKDWNDIFSNKFKNKIYILDDIREIIGLALKQNNFSVNSTKIKELSIAIETAKDWKNKCQLMDNEAYKNKIINNDLDLAMCYSSDAIQIIINNQDKFDFIIPDCGTTVSVDTFVILKQSKNKDLAYKFLDTLYKKENAAKNSEYIGSPMLIYNLSSLLSEKYKNNKYMNFTDEMIKKYENILDIGNNLFLYNKAWDEIKNN